MITRKINDCNVATIDNISECALDLLTKSPLKSASIQKQDLEKRIAELEESLNIQPKQEQVKSASTKSSEPAWIVFRKIYGFD